MKFIETVRIVKERLEKPYYCVISPATYRELVDLGEIEELRAYLSEQSMVLRVEPRVSWKVSKGMYS